MALLQALAAVCSSAKITHDVIAALTMALSMAAALNIKPIFLFEMKLSIGIIHERLLRRNFCMRRRQCPAACPDALYLRCTAEMLLGMLF